MMAWWSDMGSVALLGNLIFAATFGFAALTGLMVFLSVGRSKNQINGLSKELSASRRQAKALEKAAETIRKELLEFQQYHDIDQLKLKTSNSSAEELRQALLDARKRLEIAEAAVRERQLQQADTAVDSSEPTLTLDLEPEPVSGLSESQRDHLIGLLDPGPKGNVDIICVLGDQESELTAQELEEVLANDGWKTNGVTPSAFTRPPSGIVLAVNSKETAPSYASFLQRVFATIGMTVSAKLDSKFREWSLTIIVGTADDT